MIYRFASFELDLGAFSLRDGGTTVHVEPMVFDLIVFFAENAGRIVSRDEIIDTVWDGRIVSDATVSSCIKSARKALGDSGATQNVIRTVRGRGFQFVATIAEPPAPVEVQVPRSAPAEIADTSPSEIEAGRPSIAVLPLQLLTPVDRYGALGDAVAQEVILELSRLHWLFVTARASSFQFRDPGLDLKRVSEVLGVRYIVTGSLAVHGKTSVVAIELTQADTGRIIWANRFEQPISELLLLREAIAASIVTTIETRIQTAEAIRAGRLSTENLDAWSAYHRGLWHMFRFNRDDNIEAGRLFSLATKDDPYFARAHAGLSFTHFQNAFLNYAPDREQHARLARTYAERSHDLDPLDPFVNLTMARSHWIEGEVESALPWLARSIEINPNFAFAIYNRALLGVMQGEGEASADNVARAIALSPIDPLNYAMLSTRAMSHLIRGDYEGAAEWARKSIQAPNAHYHIFAIAAVAYECVGKRELALECVRKLRQMQPGFTKQGFFQAFPFSDGNFRRVVELAFASLDIS